MGKVIPVNHFFGMKEMELHLLSERPQFVQHVVSHLWAEWQRDYVTLTDWKTPEALAHFYEHVCGKENDIPVAYVAHEGGEFVGTCLVDNEDMGVHPENKPWLASVYVVPERRGQGYATRMLERILPMYPILHLWTFNRELAAFYERFGFVEQEVIAEHGGHIDVIYLTRKAIQ